MTAPTASFRTDASDLGFDDERLARLGTLVEREIEAGRYDGTSLSVRRGGESVLRADWGFADREAGRPLASDTVFATFSLCKQFVNVVALSFVERGLLDLHTPLAAWLPAMAQGGKETATLFHLLTHTAGLYTLFPPLPIDQLGINSVVAEFTYRFPGQGLPGERVSYSAMCAHAVLGELLLEVDGRRRSFTQLMIDELFTPLGMLDTSVGLRPDLSDRMATVIGRQGGESTMTPEATKAFGAAFATEGYEVPGGSFWTTIADLDRFAEMLRRGGELDGNRILSPAMIDFATRNYTGTDRNTIYDYTRKLGWTPWPANIGVGFFMRGEGVTPGPAPLLASPRTYLGFGAGSTCFWIDPQRDLTFTLLTTGLMESLAHQERCRRLGDLVISALVD